MRRTWLAKRVASCGTSVVHAARGLTSWVRLNHTRRLPLWPQLHFCVHHTFFRPNCHAPAAGFPTLKFFGENKERPEDYNGGRDTGSLAAFATQHWSAQQPPPEVRYTAGDV